MKNTTPSRVILLLAGLSWLTASCIIPASELTHLLTGVGDTPPPSGNAGGEGNPCDPKPNGCGPSDFWARIIPDCPLGLACFTEACSQHDLCYATCGSAQAGCDSRFYLDMRGICENNYAEDDPQFGRCIAVASVYYRAVDLYGQGPFDLSQVAICACLERTRNQTAQAERPIPFDPIVAAYPDDDHDLMPDDWELEVGLDPSNPLDAFEDPDSDGLANLTEFIHGTDPFNPDSDGDGLDDGTEARLFQESTP